MNATKPFDLEAVANGAEFETVEGQECKFGGFSPDRKTFVVWLNLDQRWDAEEFSTVSVINREIFRMKPRKMKKEGWINVYRNEVIRGIFETEKEADDNALLNHRVACIPVTLEWLE